MLLSNTDHCSQMLHTWARLLRLFSNHLAAWVISSLLCNRYEATAYIMGLAWCDVLANAHTHLLTDMAITYACVKSYGDCVTLPILISILGFLSTRVIVNDDIEPTAFNSHRLVALAY